MKLIKSLLLGSAAGLVAVAGAQAADLGVKKPSAVEYVKTCPTYGAGFFVVPGTTSCLKIVGRVRVDYLFNNDQNVFSAATRRNGSTAALAFGSTKDKNTFRARAYLGFDHRTATEYGLLRTYVRLYTERNNATNGGQAGIQSSTAVSNGINIEYAFIQFGGLTVGRVTPVFEHGFNAHHFAVAGGTTGGLGGFSDIFYVNSIGYTANFGGGFSATVALDSSKERQSAIVTGAGALATLGGQAMPDVVAALAYDAAWGSVKLSGAAHQVRGGLVNRVNDSKIGYAGQLAAKINLPFLAKGSNIWAAASVASGASSYTGWQNAGAVQVGQYSFNSTDAVIDAAGKLHLTSSWGIGGGIQAFVTPTVWVGLAGSYGVHDQFGARNTLKGTTAMATVGWQPVAGFLIGGEVAYRAISGGGLTSATTGTAGAVAGASKNDITGRIRFQRDF
jgi:Porin subfamily